MTNLQKALCVLLVLVAPVSSFGQSFGKGATVISVGYGFPNTSAAFFSAYEDNTGFKSSGVGPAHAKFEYGVSNVVGLGLSINYVGMTMSYTDMFDNYNYKYTRNSVKFNLRSNFHYVRKEHLDVYSGFGIGYGITTSTFTTNDPSTPTLTFKNPLPIGFEITTGLRYLITPNIGVYTEVGLAKSIFQVGACFKFGGEDSGGAY